MAAFVCAQIVDSSPLTMYSVHGGTERLMRSFVADAEVTLSLSLSRLAGSHPRLMFYNTRGTSKQCNVRARRRFKSSCLYVSPAPLRVFAATALVYPRYLLAQFPRAPRPATDPPTLLPSLWPRDHRRHCSLLHLPERCLDCKLARPRLMQRKPTTVNLDSKPAHRLRKDP